MRMIMMALALMLVLPGLSFAMGSAAEKMPVVQAGPTEKLSVVTVGGVRHDFNVEVVSTPDKMMQGLMYRTSMPADHGMLFIFPTPGERGFWMKNTLIPLDIIFIDESGKILNVGHGEPHSLETVRSAGVALHVLELNAGTAQRLGFGAGDRVMHAAFGNALVEK